MGPPVCAFNLNGDVMSVLQFNVSLFSSLYSANESIIRGTDIALAIKSDGKSTEWNRYWKD